MKNIKAGLAAVLLSIMLLFSPAVSPIISSATADAVCEGTQSVMCPAQVGTMKLAAEMPVAKMSHRFNRCACTGKFGTALKKCQCECKGESGFPCHFHAATGPQHPAACLCE